MTIWRYYSNVAVQDTLAVTGGGNLSTSATSIQAGSGSPQGYPTQYPWILRLEPATANEELVLVTAGAGTSGSPWTITRAQDGTTAKTHTAGTAIAHGMSATDLSTAATHYNQGSGSAVHGLPATAWLTSGLTLLADTTLANSTTSSVSGGSWSSLSGSYKHLVIVGQGRLTETTVQSDDILVQFNGDAGSVYSYLTIYAQNSGGTMTGPVTGNGYALSSAPLFRLTASQGGSAVNSGGGWAFIPNYTGTAFNKNFYSVSGGGNGTTSFVDMRLRMGIYAPSTQAAITSIAILCPGSSNFLLGTRFSLYGLS